jgi:hypothetical protein
MIHKAVQVAQSFATKKVLKQFAQKFEFVYFGRVGAEDEYELVRGITLTAHHLDMHFMVGNFRHHDITIVERHTEATFPGKPTQSYRWLIMQFDLRRGGFCHTFFDAHHHDAVFYANFFLRFADFEEATALFNRHDPLFTKHFKAFAPRAVFDEVWSTFTPQITGMLAHHFRQFDYEVNDDHLFVYASNAVITMQLLQEMMRIGMWLADQLNAQPKTQ